MSLGIRAQKKKEIEKKRNLRIELLLEGASGSSRWTTQRAPLGLSRDKLRQNETLAKGAALTPPYIQMTLLIAAIMASTHSEKNTVFEAIRR